MRYRYRQPLTPVTAALAAAVALMLAGCAPAGAIRTSAVGGTTDPTTAVVNAAQATARAGSARIAATFQNGDSGQALTTTGLIDFQRHLVRLSSSLLQSQNGQTTITLLADGVLYQQLPPSFADRLGRHWVKLDLSGLGAAAQPNVQDVSHTLELLTGAANFRQIGSDTIRVGTATHYQGTVDRAKLDDSNLAPQLRQWLDRSGATTIPSDAWVDQQGRLAKLRYTLNLANPSTQTRVATVVTTLEFWDFGTPVDVQLPAPGDTTDLGTLKGTVQVQPQPQTS
ncbi:MAG TPA: hypothetical protein VF995_09055 [Actinomycetota bacterium]